MKFIYETFLRSVLSNHYIEHIFHGAYCNNAIGHILDGNYNFDTRVGWNYIRELDSKLCIIGKV